MSANLSVHPLVNGLAHLYLAIRTPFPQHMMSTQWLPLRAALALAPHLQKAQAHMAYDIYRISVVSAPAAQALVGDFAPERLVTSLSAPHLLSLLPILTRAQQRHEEDARCLQRTLRAIQDHVGTELMSTAIHACLGIDRTSQPTIARCAALVGKYFPHSVLTMAQRYGHELTRLHGPKPLFIMLDRWLKQQVKLCECGQEQRIQREALVEALSSPLARAAVMIYKHPLLSPPSWEAVEAAFEPLSLDERLMLLLHRWNNLRLEQQLSLLGVDAHVRVGPKDFKHAFYLSDENDCVLACHLINVPDRVEIHEAIGRVCASMPEVRALLTDLLKAVPRSDGARVALARALIKSPIELHMRWDLLGLQFALDLARHLPDAALRKNLEQRVTYIDHIDEICAKSHKAIAKLIEQRFGAHLRQLRDPIDVASVYETMIRDDQWSEAVDKEIRDAMIDYLSTIAGHGIVHHYMNIMRYSESWYL